MIDFRTMPLATYPAIRIISAVGGFEGGHVDVLHGGLYGGLYFEGYACAYCVDGPVL